MFVTPSRPPKHYKEPIRLFKVVAYIPDNFSILAESQIRNQNKLKSTWAESFLHFPLLVIVDLYTFRQVNLLEYD